MYDSPGKSLLELRMSVERWTWYQSINVFVMKTADGSLINHKKEPSILTSRPWKLVDGNGWTLLSNIVRKVSYQLIMVFSTPLDFFGGAIYVIVLFSIVWNKKRTDCNAKDLLTLTVHLFVLMILTTYCTDLYNSNLFIPETKRRRNASAPDVRDYSLFPVLVMVPLTKV